MVTMDMLELIMRDLMTKNNDTDRTSFRMLLNNGSNISFIWNSEILPRYHTGETVLLILGYAIIAIISIFGNSLVCYVIFKNRRLYTPTNFFLANLAISDLLVTCLNIPFNIARNLLDEWPFGNVLCHLVNFSLIVSVYVSTYTLTVIALDRHRVIVNPFTSRLSKVSSVLIVGGIWFIAVCLALPYGIFNKVEDVDLIVTTVRRCRSRYPSAMFEQCLTVFTMILQYFVPLIIIGTAYSKIVHKLWIRTHVGAVTANQQISQAKSKRKSIKLLITVFIVFAICWLPINLYHILTNIHPDVQTFQYDSRVFFFCHWLAVSSTCYNPFVYCWLNETFKQEVMLRFLCGIQRLNVVSKMELFVLRCKRGGNKRPRTDTMNSLTLTSFSSVNTCIIQRDASNNIITNLPEELVTLVTKKTINSRKEIKDGTLEIINRSENKTLE